METASKVKKGAGRRQTAENVYNNSKLINQARQGALSRAIAIEERRSIAGANRAQVLTKETKKI